MKERQITRRQVAEFRYSVIGELFSRPPEKGHLAERIREIAAKQWWPPGSIHGETYTTRTIERWYSAATKNKNNPIAALIPKTRKDFGVRKSLTKEHIAWLVTSFKDWPKWSMTLRADNLTKVKELPPAPSLSTVLRWAHAEGRMRVGIRGTLRKRHRETLSFESPFPGALWHLDFHKGSRRILLPNGQYEQPLCVAFIDDHSRLCTHCQWVLAEDTASLVHGIIQAFMKFGLPHKIHSDNGSPIISEEFEEGLRRLAIKHETIIPKAAFQNGKIESLWNPIEGRLLKMLGGIKPLTLEVLNHYTQPWVLVDYNRKIHSETGQKPFERYHSDRNVARKAFEFDQLRVRFRRIVDRTQRLSDGTFTIDGVRFQTPRPFRHMRKLKISYAFWNLTEAGIVDPRDETIIATAFPVDKNRNAEGMRAPMPALFEEPSSLSFSLDKPRTIPPLLEHCVEEYARDNPLAGFIPMNTKEEMES